MNTDKLAINWQNFARVWSQRKFAFIIRALLCHTCLQNVLAVLQCIHLSEILEIFCS